MARRRTQEGMDPGEPSGRRSKDLFVPKKDGSLYLLERFESYAEPSKRCFSQDEPEFLINHTGVRMDSSRVQTLDYTIFIDAFPLALPARLGQYTTSYRT